MAFPVGGLLNTDITQAAAFVESHPTHNGKGVVVAIFDTGVDPNTEGLQTTPDGQSKWVDFLDTTGSGDVDTSLVVQATDAKITGVTGRTLAIPADWVNPSGNWHIGAKKAYDLIPKVAKKRFQEKRQKAFAKERNGIEATMDREWVKVQKEFPPDAQAKDLTAKQSVDDHALRAKLCREMAFEDQGPVYDCIVWNDGSVWRACVDTSERGELYTCKVLTDYRLEHDVAQLSEELMVNFTVNIYDDGNVLCIVTPGGSHGSHVAGIIGGYYPSQPELNGVAPGVRLVSVKIGCSRLGTMEVLPGLLRGLRACIDLQVDVVNMSYGEASSLDNFGVFKDMAQEMVYKHGILFVASAGNEGPALGTTGAPGASCDAIMSVGALVSPDMMQSLYSLPNEHACMPYTWSSRGPTKHGALGVTITAPGGAITCVPQSYLSKSQLMNGTSMSSPNACGCISLILSGMKASSKHYSPHRIRSAVENTAKMLPGLDRFAVGQGVVQVASAFDSLMKFADVKYLDVLFSVQVKTLEGQTMNGLYLRDPAQTNRSQRMDTVCVRPVFHEDSAHGDKVTFEIRLQLVSTVPWVKHASHLFLYNMERSFPIVTDVFHPSLRSGANFGEILAYDCDRPDGGPVFRVPITVVKSMSLPSPSEVSRMGALSKFSGKDAVERGVGDEVFGKDGNSFEFRSLVFRSGAVARRFISVPSGAVSAEIELSCTAVEGSEKTVLWLHTHYVWPHRSHPETSFSQVFRITQNESKCYTHAVKPNTTLEVCLAQNWSKETSATVDLKVSFNYVSASKTEIRLSDADLVQRVELAWEGHGKEMSSCPSESSPHASTPCGSVIVQPSASLTSHRMPLSPEPDAKPIPMSADRDVMVDDKLMYALVLEYKLEMPYKSSISVVNPLFDRQLYEGVMGSRAVQLYNKHKQLVGCGDVMPRDFHVYEDLAAGSGYVLRMQLAHPSVKVLSRYTSMPLWVQSKLEKPVSVPLFWSRGEATTGPEGGKADKRALTPFSRVPLYVRTPSCSSMSFLKPGHQLVGSMLLDKDAKALPGTGVRTVSVPVFLNITTTAKSATATKSTPEESNGDCLKRSLVAWLKQLSSQQEKDVAFRTFVFGDEFGKAFGGKDGDAAHGLNSSLLAQYPHDVAVLLLALDYTFSFLNKQAGAKEEDKKDVVGADELWSSLCKKLKDSVSLDELSGYFGRKRDVASMNAEDKKAHQKFEDAKGAWVWMLEKELLLASKATKDKKEDADQRLSWAVDELRAWGKEPDGELADALVCHYRKRGRLGACLELVNKEIGKGNAAKSMYELRGSILRELGWTLWADHDAAWDFTRFPAEYQLF